MLDQNIQQTCSKQYHNRAHGILPTIMNATNEAAINLFLDNKIHFSQIYNLIDYAIQTSENINEPDIPTILNFNKETFRKIKRDYKKILEI